MPTLESFQVAAAGRLRTLRGRAREQLAGMWRHVLSGAGRRHVLTVPQRAWAAAGPRLDAPRSLLTDFSPLPPSASFRRWLPVPVQAPLVGLKVSAGFAPQQGAYPVQALLRMLDSWPEPEQTSSAGSTPLSPVPVLLVDPASCQDVIASLRDRSSRPAVVVVPVPAQTQQRAVLYTALSALLMPGPSPAESWATEVLACGVPVIVASRNGELAPGLPLPWGDSRLLSDAARRSRLHAVDSAATPSLETDKVSPTRHPPTSDVRRARVSAEPRRVVVAGHDLKFAQGLITYLKGQGHEVRIDEWTGHQRHDPERSRALAGWADAVLCEWTLGNAVWYSRHTPRQVRLTTRLHLQEAALAYPGLVRQERMDRFIVVADHVRRRVVRDHGLDPARTVMIPNAVRAPQSGPSGDEVAGSDRARTLGMVGILPARKGLHRALDLVAELRRRDPRFILRIKGRLPQDQNWMAGRTQEAAYFREQWSRIESDPLVAGAVRLDGFGADMPQWYSQVGYALSLSDFESFHFTLPDGAVHGVAPVSLAWPGADELYPRRWLHADVAGMAETVHRLSLDDQRRERWAAEARSDVLDQFAEPVVLPRLAREVLGG